jgi:enoyl-CoA hydratase
MDNEVVLFHRDGPVALVTLNQPEALNVVNWDFLTQLETIQNSIEADQSIKAVIINANGDHFSAGIDLKLLQQVSSQFVLDKLVWLQRLYSRWQDMPIPVVAAVQGVCYGSGVELILGCDIRIASEDVKISIPEVAFGLSPDMGGTTRLTQLVGIGQAKRLILGCEVIDSQEALRIGLVEIVVPKEQLQKRALKLAHKMAGFPPVAVRFAKKGINLANESSVAAGLLFEQAQSAFCCGTEDQNEAITAFFEKRPGVYKGR